MNALLFTLTHTWTACWNAQLPRLQISSSFIFHCSIQHKYIRENQRFIIHDAENVYWCTHPYNLTKIVFVSFYRLPGIRQSQKRMKFIGVSQLFSSSWKHFDSGVQINTICVSNYILKFAFGPLRRFSHPHYCHWTVKHRPASAWTLNPIFYVRYECYSISSTVRALNDIYCTRAVLQGQ